MGGVWLSCDLHVTTSSHVHKYVCPSPWTHPQVLCEVHRLNSTADKLKQFIDYFLSVVMETNPTLLAGMPSLQHNTGVQPQILTTAGKSEVSVTRTEEGNTASVLTSFMHTHPSSLPIPTPHPHPSPSLPLIPTHPHPHPSSPPIPIPTPHPHPSPSLPLIPAYPIHPLTHSHPSSLPLNSPISTPHPHPSPSLTPIPTHPHLLQLLLEVESQEQGCRHLQHYATILLSRVADRDPALLDHLMGRGRGQGGPECPLER